MLGRIEEWKAEAAQASAGFARSQEARLSAIQAKLDRLLDVHLDEVITREEYLGRKEKLLCKKAGWPHNEWPRFGETQITGSNRSKVS